MHAFTGTDGLYPRAALIQATGGNFYGTTTYGGSGNRGSYSGCGNVFRITPSGTFTVMHDFTARDGDGAHPIRRLIQATDGNFYGTTFSGGETTPSTGFISGSGTVFQMTPGGTLTILHAFTNAPEGAAPKGALIQGMDGNFYGTTAGGGSSQRGTVFQITPAAPLRSCTRSPEGITGDPQAALFQTADGTLYGTTSQGRRVGFWCGVSSQRATVAQHSLHGRLRRRRQE